MTRPALVSVRCLFCPREDVVANMALGESDRLPEVAPPPGWHVLDGKLICSDHDVIVERVKLGRAVAKGREES